VAKAISNIALILAALSMLGALGSVFVGMIRAGHGGVDGVRRGNQMMWWRVRLQVIAVGLAAVWYFLKGA
jgi:hypothetical protein